MHRLRIAAILFHAAKDRSNVGNPLVEGLHDELGGNVTAYVVLESNVPGKVLQVYPGDIRFACTRYGTTPCVVEPNHSRLSLSSRKQMTQSRDERHLLDENDAHGLSVFQKCFVGQEVPNTDGKYP